MQVHVHVFSTHPSCFLKAGSISSNCGVMLGQKVSSVTSVSEIDRLKISLLNCLMCSALEYFMKVNSCLFSVILG